MRTALVLGAGGITGIAWQLGMISGLRAAGVDLGAADVLVGTSAGAICGTLLASGHDKMDARTGPDDPPVRPDWERGSRAYAVLNDEQKDQAAIRAEVGALAREANVVGEEAYVNSISRRLPAHAWPDRPFLITAVDATTGEPVVWDRASGVPLDRAVAASCAVPCIFPPVTIGDRRFMDGGVRSGTNADLAAGAERVVVLAPLALVRMRGAPADEIEALRRTARTALIAPDEAMDPFDLDRWDQIVKAAEGQGRRAAEDVVRQTGPWPARP